MSEIAQKVHWQVNQSAIDEFGGYSGVDPGNLEKAACTSQLKRLIDIMGAGFGLLVLSPFLAVIALVVILDSNGPVIFRQRRSGLHGKTFMIYKFRTMKVMEDDAEVTHATRGDNRVTRVGKFLRRSSIDELPQLINVLKGEMSLVGPRPHAIAHDLYYEQACQKYHERFQVKPGITGLAQISGFRGEIRDTQHMQGRVARDIEYIENWSLAMDVGILFLTVTTAPFHDAAY